MEDEAPPSRAPPARCSTTVFATATPTGDDTSPYGYGQPELLHSLPLPYPLPSPELRSSESDPASSSMIPSYQRISQPSFIASGNIISVDLDAPVFSPLSSFDDDQPQQLQQAQPASTTSTGGMVLGQTENFGLAQDTSMQPSLSLPSSFGPSPMHDIPFPNMQDAPPMPSQSQIATPLMSLGSQQQPAWSSSSLAPPLQGRTTRSSSRPPGLPPRWQPPRSRIDTITTFGYVQLSSDSTLAPLPPSLQTLPSPMVEQTAPTGSQTVPGQEAGFILPQGNDAMRALMGQPLLDSASRERFQLSRSRSSFMDDSAMFSMPTLSIGASGSSGSVLFTDAEMEKIGKEERLGDLMKTDPKRVRRMLKNRESALKSKEREKTYRVGLEDQLRALEMEHEALSRQEKLQQEELAEVRYENRMLNTRLQGLDQQLKLKEELYEALRSRIQNLKLANLSSSSSFHQPMSLAGGQCSNSGLHQHMRIEVHMGSHMVQLEQPEIKEQSLEHQEDKAAEEPQEK